MITARLEILDFQVPWPAVQLVEIGMKYLNYSNSLSPNSVELEQFSTVDFIGIWHV